MKAEPGNLAKLDLTPTYPKARFMRDNRGRVWVQLTTADMDLYDAYAGERLEARDDNENADVYGVDHLYAYRVGAYGEMAACRYYGQPFKGELAADGGADLIVAGRLVNVKTNGWHLKDNPRLAVLPRQLRLSPADVFLLAVANVDRSSAAAEVLPGQVILVGLARKAWLEATEPRPWKRDTDPAHQLRGDQLLRPRWYVRDPAEGAGQSQASPGGAP